MPQITKQSFVRQAIILARPYNAILPAIGVAIGWFIAAPTGVVFSRLSLVVLIASYVLLHSGLTIWNDIEDEAIDDGPDRRGLHAIRSMRRMTSLQIVTVALIGAGVIAAGSMSLRSFVVAVCIVVCGYVYNARPLQLSRRPLSSIVVLMAFYGMLPVLLGASYFGYTWESVLLAVGYALLRGSLSILKDFKDAPSDAKHNKRTFLLVYGAKRVAYSSITLAVIGYGSVIACVAYYYWNIAWVLLATLVAVVLLVRRLELRRQTSYTALNAVFHRCLHYQIVFDGIMLLWLVW